MNFISLAAKANKFFGLPLIVLDPETPQARIRLVWKSSVPFESLRIESGIMPTGALRCNVGTRPCRLYQDAAVSLNPNAQDAASLLTPISWRPL